MNTLKKLLSVLLLVSLFVACDKDDGPSKEDELALRMNQFVQNTMSVFYLWNNELPDLSPESEKDPKEYFGKLLSSKDDWSIITDDVNDLMGQINGTGETFGYGLAYGKFSNSEKYFAIVQYVYPNSPADGQLKRGDAIIQIGGKDITEDDLKKLNQHGKIQLGTGTISGNMITPTGQAVTLQSKVMDTDPVLITRFFEKGSHKIGYLMYTGFMSKFNASIATAFNNFKSKGITDLVLDLRYNHGGEDAASVFLCSAIAPKDKAVKGELLSKEIWNTECQKTFENDPQYDGMLHRYFDDVNCNLELSTQRVYILTSHETVSASEYTIACLEAFMDVILVGTQTYGKYVTMYAFSPTREENGEIVEDKELANWLIFPVCSRFTSIKDYPNTLKGLEPDFEVKDDLFNAIDLGDEREPLLAKAIALITGENQRQAKAMDLLSEPPFEIIKKSLNDLNSNRLIFMK